MRRTAIDKLHTKPDEPFMFNKACKTPTFPNLLISRIELDLLSGKLIEYYKVFLSISC